MSHEKNTGVHPIVKQIINRDCHVSMRNREVIRHVISRLKDGWRTYRAMPRKDRKALMLQCIRCHRENWRLYVDVMSGGSNSRRRNGRRAAADGRRDTSRAKLTVAPVMTGVEIVSLMRRHRVTIRALSQRMQITQKRIRQVRQSGLQDRNSARDWIEAITGCDPGPLSPSGENA